MGRWLAATRWLRWRRTWSRLSSWSSRPSDHAKPELVEASALKPRASRRLTPPMSQGFGRMKEPDSCNSRKALRLSATESDTVPDTVGTAVSAAVPDTVGTAVRDVATCGAGSPAAGILAGSHVRRPHGGEELLGVRTLLTRSVARALCASEGHVEVDPGRRQVDHRHADLGVLLVVVGVLQRGGHDRTSQ